MTQAKNYTIILIAMSLAFALGYYFQGYQIYGEFFKGTVAIMPDVSKK